MFAQSLRTAAARMQVKFNWINANWMRCVWLHASVLCSRLPNNRHVQASKFAIAIEALKSFLTAVQKQETHLRYTPDTLRLFI